MTYETNTRPEVHAGDTITIGNHNGYHETIIVGSATIIDHGRNNTLHVHQAETNDIYDITDERDGWTLEQVDCPHPPAMQFPGGLPMKHQCLRCAWADWLTFPEVETTPPSPPSYSQPQA
ncbi:hypothetical protein [Bifidobacterium pseudolongum]|uniref:hypothetical protein n=1 Tax=Bifidobacterium pseudolongum TaxID=1694 RepID=UPI001021F533|nr:hypothetical protein [Bifidobacterium pseudolongum]MCH4860928.1 hypothetical protein [Bifidobacterium pseudolongum]MCH4862700.1 hypothetical protein [Bifidobacterium pseudolongum]RYQ41877.1 hypothetical protein PG1791B_1654 [Bifidobacterium pseudolongum subsp. globosum]